MDAIVIEDQVQAGRRRKLAIEPTQEAQKLLMAVTRVVLGDHPPLADMERGKQAGRAMPFIVVGEGPAAAMLQGQAWLRAIQRLNLALLVHTEHHGVLRWLQIDADHVGELLHKLRIPRQLEGLRQMRLELMILPCPVNRVLADAYFLAQRTSAPVGCTDWLRLQGALDPA